jgi:hypothetical protein
MFEHYGCIPSIGKWCVMFASVTTSWENCPLVFNIWIFSPEFSLLHTGVKHWDLYSLSGMN